MLAELKKLTAHRTPWIATAVLALGVLAPPVVMLFYTPDDPTAYGEVSGMVFALLGALVAAVFGAWVLGTEYRQGTVKRMLATESRRGLALSRKAAVGGGLLAALLTATALAGFGASWLVGNLNDVSVTFDGRGLLGAGVFAMGAAAVAFGLSAITKSDSFATVGTVGMVLVLDPLLSLIPKVGDYTFGATLSQVTDEIAGGVSPFSDPPTLGIATATLVAVGWIVAFVGSGSYLFATRDA